MLLVSSVKRALGKANAAPSLDFESEMSIDPQAGSEGRVYSPPKISYDPSYNPFKSDSSAHTDTLQKVNRQNWENLFEGFKNNNATVETAISSQQESLDAVKKESIEFEAFQLHNKYIITAYEQNVMIVDQQRAHERIVYEHYLHTKREDHISSQQLLFPEQIELSTNDFSLVKGLLEDFRHLGFDLEIFGKNSIVVNGIPADMQDFNPVEVIEGILETYKLNTIDAKVEKRDNLCRAIARNVLIKYGKTLEKEEIKLLLNHLMQCENPLYTAGGKTVMMNVDYSDIEKFFRK
jgi:DNA mismatch repair protein MutL